MKNISIDRELEFFELKLLTEDVISKTLSEDYEGQMSPFLKKRNNKVRIGIPFCEIITDQADQLPSEIKQKYFDYNFFFLRTSCSFLPESDCIFSWARFSIFLKTFFGSSNIETEKKPFVWDLFPREITSTIETEDTLSITSELKFQIGSIDFKDKLFDISSKNKYLRYEPTLFSYGTRGYSKFSWDFNSTNGKELFGDKTDLYAIIGIVKGSKLEGEFSIDAKIKLRGKIGNFFSNRDEKVVCTKAILIDNN